MTALNVILLFVAAILGGAINAVAGGGSFMTFPSLVVTGILPINANATSTVSLWPGAVASIGAYRRELATLNRTFVILLSISSFIGGLVGALLLLHSSQSTFSRLIPFLLLMATILFAFGPTLTRRVRQQRPATDGAPLSSRAMGIAAAVQLVIAVYGGYFGGGIGILMLATLGFMGMENIHEMNALKTLLNACINGVAVVAFILAGIVVWPQAIIMLVGAIAGGYAGAHYARKIAPRYVRALVITVGIAMTIYFFVRQYS